MGFLSDIIPTVGKVASIFTGNPAYAIGGDLIGGFADNSERRELNDTQFLQNERAFAQNQANFAQSRADALEMNNRNIELQKEFAQHGVSWRVDDARQAGLHPLYAIGSAGASYSPVSSVGGSMTHGSSGGYIASSGQNINRAIAAAETASMQERRTLENDLLKAQIGKERAITDQIRLDSEKVLVNQNIGGPFPAHGSTGQYGPFSHIESYPLPMSARDNAGKPFGAVVHKPDEVTSRYPGKPYRTAGDHALFKEVRTPGGPMLVPNSDDFEIDAALVPAMFGSNWHDYGLRNALNSFTGGMYEKFNQGLYRLVSDHWPERKTVYRPMPESARSWSRRMWKNR